MKTLRHFLLAPTLALTLGLQAQSPAVTRMKAHIELLSSDSLMGRETGTDGEALASDYIAKAFKQSGLKPAGLDGSYLQPFEFFNRRQVNPDSYLEISGKRMEVGTDFMPLPESMTADFGSEIISVGFGISAPDWGHDDYKGKDVHDKFVLIERGHHEPDNPHSKFADLATISAKLKVAAEKGAIGAIFVDAEGQGMEPLTPNYNRNVSAENIVAVYFPNTKVSALDGKKILGYVSIEDETRTGNNVAGYLDHGAPYTVVIGAHYDHLGMGEEGSLHRGEALAIHNGADDNASGTALVMELANTLKDAPYQKYNYLLIAFSGEEKGLLGSNFFTKNPTINLDQVACMINFDMVGRLDPAKNTLGINGVGTSPTWNKLLPAIQIDDMKVKTSESGVGPSDQTSFYLKDIPAIHYFSGTHADYHKPSDDAHLINYDGIDKIYRHVLSLVGKLNESGEKLAFTATKQDENENVPRWKVTLGVVPDYMYSEEGMRIDGVTEGKPAFKAGLKAGDIVIQMGDMEVKDMMSYMQALSKFDKGQTVVVTVIRDGKQKKKKVTFF